MNYLLWIAAAILAAVLALSGATKLASSRDALHDRGLRWVEDFSDQTVRAIGGVEVLAALGLILPAAVGVAPIVVPTAAVGIIVLMVAAALTHLRRSESSMVWINLVLLLMAVFVSVGRFVARPF